MKIGARVIKTAIAVPIAVTIANSLNLNHYTTAGIIALLTIQNSRKKTLTVAISRIFSILTALAIATSLFLILGVTPFSFGLFLIIFVPIAAHFKMNDSIVISTVLVTHILSSGLSINIIINCLSIMLVGISIGSIANLHISNNFKNIQIICNDIDEKIKTILFEFANNLNDFNLDSNAYKYLDDLNKLINTSINIISNYNENNSTTQDSLYYLKYIEMQKKQFEILQKMDHYLKNLTDGKQQALLIHEFTLQVANEFNITNDGLQLIEKLELLMEEFKNQELPKSRKEFENRSHLYLYCLDFQTFISIRNHFLKQHN